MNYETYISKELIAAKADRAITGLSMGGHGAFYLAFNHQDIWGAASTKQMGYF